MISNIVYCIVHMTLRCFSQSVGQSVSQSSFTVVAVSMSSCSLSVRIPNSEQNNECAHSEKTARRRIREFENSRIQFRFRNSDASAISQIPPLALYGTARQRFNTTRQMGISCVNREFTVPLCKVSFVDKFCTAIQYRRLHWTAFSSFFSSSRKIKNSKSRKNQNRKTKIKKSRIPFVHRPSLPPSDTTAPLKVLLSWDTRPV